MKLSDKLRLGVPDDDPFRWWLNHIVIGFLVAFGIIGWLTSCSHLTVAPKPVSAHSIAFDKNTQNAGVIDCDSQGCKVTANWVAKYRQLQSEFKNTFPDDVAIKVEGNHYRAPYDVIENFTRLKAAERGM